MKKRFLLVFLFIFVIIFILIFVKNNYKKIQFGNNKNNKSVEKIEEYILNISSYKTTMEVTVTSNKNENKYLIKQEHNNDKNIQIIEEPETIKGVEIIENEGKVEVKNSNLNLSQIYNEYPYISENILWLNSFINLYKNEKNSSKIYELNDEIIMELNNKNNKYFSNIKLFIDRKSGNPKRMIVQDNNQKNKIYILYKEIIINE
ncbi:MAG: hypothetical protein IKE91_00705 [Clostridia bacterium]|nr:hypothetical protein [Clostridia bacterium]